MDSLWSNLCVEAGKITCGFASPSLPEGTTAPTAPAVSTGPDRTTSAVSASQNYEVPDGPMLWLTSSGFVSDHQWARFIQVVMKRRGVLRKEDEVADATREDLVKKYSDEIKKLKVTYINDASHHRPTQSMVKGRSGAGTVGEKFLGRGEGTWFWWDQGLEDLMGVPKQNITMIQILEKPWLFNRPGREANYHPSSPSVWNLDLEDEKRYYAALKHTQDAYDALKEDPPKVGAGQAGGSLPGCPDSGLSCADHLAKVSVELNEKYAEALDKWCDEYIDGADIILGQGGEVVMLNMAWQCNQTLATRVIKAVRENNTVYAGLSASTMVCAKSIEMTGEIQPGWIEAFACHKEYLHSEYFDANDLDGDGIHHQHLGALPLVDALMAIRPHYSEAWEDEVLRKNLIAEHELEQETGYDIDDDLVRNSRRGCEQACQLLSLISRLATTQDNPVFIPIHNGSVIEVSTVAHRTSVVHSHQYIEVFSCVP